MSTRLEAIRILTDGKPGHENQSIGLAEALRRRTGAQIELVWLDVQKPFWARMRQARALAAGKPRPQLVIAAGHNTHLPLLAASWRFGARSVVIMKPSLPAGCFDLCLLPSHDVKPGKTAGRRVIVTQGALNRISEDTPVKSDHGLLLVGGPSKHHDWDEAPLLKAIAEIVRGTRGLGWTLTDSRRTPPGFLDKLAALELPSLTLVSNTETPRGWLPQQLLGARQAWVTEDSISMIYEAITAGAHTGLLPLPAKAPQGRIARSVDHVVEAGYATRFSRWRETGVLATPPGALHEAARCADEIIARFFPTQS
ncbi:MAG TPA: mitochondrial fission ELM1 family protein [Rariglobus sp.]